MVRRGDGQREEGEEREEREDEREKLAKPFYLVRFS
jgi:hypothetical protein